MQTKSLTNLEKKIVESLDVIDKLREENEILKKNQNPNISDEKIKRIKNKLTEIVRDINDFRNLKWFGVKMTQIDEKQNEKTMTVEIYGQNYPIKGKVDSKFMDQVAGYVDESMKEIGANMSSSLAIHKIAVIAAMNIAADYLKLSDDEKKSHIDIENKSQQLIKLIDSKISS